MWVAVFICCDLQTEPTLEKTCGFVEVEKDVGVSGGVWCW